MTSYMASTAAVRMCSAVPPAGAPIGARRFAAVASLCARPAAFTGHAGLAVSSTATAGTGQSWQPELAKRSHKRFAMAGITNVWPLGPEDWSSG